MAERKPLLPPDPRSVGNEVDYRFTLANERTFLAWIRTSLALSAGGLGAIHLLPEFGGRTVIGMVLLALAFAVAASAYRRWALTEIAMRRGEPLPASRLPRLVAVGTAVVGLLASVLVIVDAVT